MKKRISVLLIAVFVTTLIVSVSDVRAAETDNGMSISATENSQEMGSECGEVKEGCDKEKKSCDKKKEGCDKQKESCDKSAAKKAECDK